MTGNGSRASDFIGRRQELAVLTAALDDALSGRGQMVMLAGEPGIGKTRLAQELASRAESLGARVLWGWCYEHAGAPPYWPWLQSIRSCVAETEPEQLREAMGAGAADIAEILPDLRTRLDGLERPPTLEPEQTRFRLFYSITTFFKNLSRVQPIVLVLDDLHWADESSLLLLEFLAHEIGSNPILVIGAYRDAEVTGRHPLTETLGSLVREENFSRVQLGGLTSQEVGELVVSRTGVAAQQDAVVALHQRTEGNPLFVGEVVGSVSQEQLAGGLTWTDGIPGVVRDAIARRLSRLSTPCSGLLDTASVIGRDFDFELLRKLSPEITEDAFLETLEEALDTRVIEALSDGPGRYRFSHALIQQAVYEGIPATGKMRAHAATGEALEQLHQSNLDEYAGELAHHFAEAGAVAAAKKGVQYCLIAGEKALDSFAYEQALVHFQRVLHAKDGHPVDSETAQAFFGLGRAQAATLPRHELMKAHLNLRRAFEYYSEEGDTAGIVAIAEFPTLPLTEHGISTGSLVERALELVPEDSLEAGRLHSLHGNVQGLTDGDYQSARVSFDRALAIARREGNPALEMRTLNFAAQVESWHHQFEDSLKSSLMAVDLAVSACDLKGEVTARYWASISSRSLGDEQEVQRQASAILAPAERLRDRYWLATAYNAVGWRHTVQGDWQSAREANQRGLDLMPLDPRILLQRVNLETQTGNQIEAEVYLERLEEVVRESEAGPTTANACLALVSPLTRSIFGSVKRPAVGETSITAVLSSHSATPFFSTWAKVGASTLAVMRNDAEDAVERYAALKPAAGIMVNHANVDRTLGLLAGTMGDWDTAAAHFEDASQFCRKAGYRPELAWSLCDHAAALLQLGGPGDRGKAASLLEEGLSIATELGMTPLVEKASVLREELVSVPAKSPTYPGGLTQREVEVLQLICGGKTDREIGEELFISVKTVGNHVSNILNKTGAVNRTEAATYAARHGIVADEATG